LQTLRHGSLYLNAKDPYAKEGVCAAALEIDKARERNIMKGGKLELIEFTVQGMT